MPERRSLRSSKPDTSSSTNGEKARSNSQSSSSNKDKPHPTRSTSSRGKSFSSKKGITSAGKETNGDQPHLNGSEPIENGVDSAVEPEVDENQSTAPPGAKKPGKDKDGDEEMTVVVPPSKASKVSGTARQDEEGDIAMNGTDNPESKAPNDGGVDTQAKAIESTFLPQLYHGSICNIY